MVLPHHQKYREALKTVPDGYRHGQSDLEQENGTIRTGLLPSAMRGVITGVIAQSVK